MHCKTLCRSGWQGTVVAEPVVVWKGTPCNHQNDGYSLDHADNRQDPIVSIAKWLMIQVCPTLQGKLFCLHQTFCADRHSGHWRTAIQEDTLTKDVAADCGIRVQGWYRNSCYYASPHIDDSNKCIAGIVGKDVTYLGRLVDRRGRSGEQRVADGGTDFIDSRGACVTRLIISTIASVRYQAVPSVPGCNLSGRE